MSLAGRASPGMDPALRFWTAFAEAEGALWEEAGDKVLVVLHEPLRAAFDLPEEVFLTSDPETAREDGALLLMSGHHVLDGAASQVIEAGDVGIVSVAWPTTSLPAAEDLLARARELVGVDHGRIDRTGRPPAPVWLPVLRIGALVRYRVSLEERFQEREEVWVDGRSGLPIPAAVVARLEHAVERSEISQPAHRKLPTHLLRAVAGGHHLLESRSAARQGELGAQARTALREEMARTDAYYEGVLASIARRVATAPPERRAVLEKQARVTEAERGRRCGEIEENYRPEHEIRPFRLHLVLAPALDLPVLVRRGERVYPLALTWILNASTFAPMACPHCGTGEGLVAGRDRLGCRACLPRRVEASTPPGPARATPPASQNRSNSTKGSPAAARPSPHEAKARRPSGRDRRERRVTEPTRPLDPILAGPPAQKAGGRLAGKFFEAVALGKRWPRKAMAPGSPFQILDELFGADASALALGITPGAVPVEATMVTFGRDPLQPRLTTGQVLVGEGWYPYVLAWRSTAGTPWVVEVFPTIDPGGRLPRREDLHADLRGRLFDRVPDPVEVLDAPSRALWGIELPRSGLPFVARSLAFWRRVNDCGVPGEHPAKILAAAVAHLTAEESRLRPKLVEGAEAHAVDPDSVKRAIADLRTALGQTASIEGAGRPKRRAV